MIIVACKQTEHLDPASLGSANDQVKIAVNYHGDENCRKYVEERNNNIEEEDKKIDIDEVIKKNESSKSHLLNGKDGELITENYRTSVPNRNNLRLSGDKFFNREPTGDDPLTIETIEENCRRLVLSVDSSKPPTITFKHGFVAKDLAKRFEKDFNKDNKFGSMNCRSTNFCTFADINDGKRYFTYLEPASDHSDIVLGLSWYVGDKQESEEAITLNNIKFDDKNRYQDTEIDHGQNYISHLYVALDKKQDNYKWEKQIGNPYFKVSLQTGAEGKLLQAEGQLNPNDHDRDLTQNVARFKVATICQRLLENTCEENLSNFRQLLLDNEVKLLFSFWKKSGGWFSGHTEESAQTVILTKQFIDNWIQRKGEIYFGSNLAPQWSSFRFIFTNPNQQYLYLSTTTTPTEQLRYEIKPSAVPECPEFKARFSPLTTATINRRALLNHLSKKSGCLARVANISDLEFLKQSLPTLSIIKKNSETYKYTFTNESIDKWWREVGEITLTAETDDEEGSGEAKTLVLGLQDRR